MLLSIRPQVWCRRKIPGKVCVILKFQVGNTRTDSVRVLDCKLSLRPVHTIRKHVLHHVRNFVTEMIACMFELSCLECRNREYVSRRIGVDISWVGACFFNKFEAVFVAFWSFFVCQVYQHVCELFRSMYVTCFSQITSIVAGNV